MAFVLGGIKSGKSNFAREEAEKFDGEVTFLATARPVDEEMERRIQNHRSRRPEDWQTRSPGYDILKIARQAKNKSDHLYLWDDLSLWVSDRLGDRSQTEIQEKITQWLKIISPSESYWIVVSALANRTIIPSNSDTREFHDVLGSVHQLIAEKSSTVIEVTAGIPNKLE
ncbi:MAG: bifunctional adenosylcobinamide kinase/adenosylcobinamide-phosphate guanylyltransferase [bacterium]